MARARPGRWREGAAGIEEVVGSIGENAVRTEGILSKAWRG